MTVFSKSKIEKFSAKKIYYTKWFSLIEGFTQSFRRDDGHPQMTRVRTCAQIFSNICKAQFEEIQNTVTKTCLLYVQSVHEILIFFVCFVIYLAHFIDRECKRRLIKSIHTSIELQVIQIIPCYYCHYHHTCLIKLSVHCNLDVHFITCVSCYSRLLV
jgi:hypothetical protein